MAAAAALVLSTFSACSAVAQRLPELEAALVGSRPGREVERAVAAALFADLQRLLGGGAALGGLLHLHLRLREQHQHLGLARAGLIDCRLEHLHRAVEVAHRRAQARRRQQRIEARGVARELPAHLLEVRGGVLETASLGRVATERQHDVREELRLGVLLHEAIADLPLAPQVALLTRRAERAVERLLADLLALVLVGHLEQTGDDVAGLF